MASKSERRANLAQKYNMQVREIRPGQTEEAYFRQLAKAADQRLLRLERLADQEGFEPVLNYAYQSAMYNIKRMTGNPNATRFNVTLQKNKDGSIDKAALHARINAVKKFLESPTSTKTGILKVYKKRADTINERYGTDFTWEELASYHEKARYAKVDTRQIGSDVILKAVALIREYSTPEELRKAAESNPKITADKVVYEVALKLLEDGLTFEDFV